MKNSLTFMLGGVFLLAACDTVIPEENGYCLRMDDNDFSIFETGYPDRPIYQLENAEVDADVRIMRGNFNAVSNSSETGTMRVDLGAKECVVTPEANDGVYTYTYTLRDNHPEL